MGDAGVSPVEQQVTALTDEDLTVVKVVVLNRLQQAVGRQLVAHLADPWDARDEPAAVAGRKLDELVEHLRELLRQGWQAKVRDAGCKHLFDVAGHVEL